MNNNQKDNESTNEESHQKDSPGKENPSNNKGAPGNNKIDGSEVNARNMQQGDHNVLNEQKIDAQGDVVEKKTVTYNQRINIKEHFSQERIKPFSVEKASCFNSDDIEESEELFVYPPKMFDDLFTCLKQYRLILLTGPPESGKLFTAKNLAFYLKKELKLKNNDILWYNPEAGAYEIKLGELIKYSEELREKIIIFNNIFYQDITTVSRFFRSLNHQENKDICERLQQLGAYLLFTADTGTFESILTTRLPFKQDIATDWDQCLLKKGLEKKLKRFCDGSDLRDTEKAGQVLGVRMEDITSRGKRMPRIALFVEMEMDKILAGKSIDDSIKEFFGNPEKTIEKWLFQDITENKLNFEYSTFALCLTLFNGINYADFASIHREITLMLLKAFIPREGTKEFVFKFSEKDYLERCRAVISNSGTSNKTLRIEFNDNEYRKALRHILWNDFRRILLQLVPLLEKSAQEANSLQLRKKAIYNLVDIGAMAPETIIFPIVHKWAQEETGRFWLNIGYLYESIFNYEDESIKNVCMKELKEITDKGTTAEQIIPVIAYREIGFKNLEFTITKFNEILQKNSKWKLKDYFRSKATIRNYDELADILKKIYEQEKDDDDILPWICYSILALASHHPPTDVLYELKKWIDTPISQSKEWAVLFVMGPNGIFEELEQRNQKYSTEDKNGKKVDVFTSDLLFPLTTDDGEVRKMADFLIQLYKKGFGDFKMNVGNSFKKKLFKHMEKWVVDNLPNNEMSEKLKEMLTHFYHAGDNKLQETFWTNITRWRCSKDNSAKLDSFVNNLRKSFFTSYISCEGEKNDQ